MVRDAPVDAGIRRILDRGDRLVRGSIQLCRHSAELRALSADLRARSVDLRDRKRPLTR